MIARRMSSGSLIVSEASGTYGGLVSVLGSQAQMASDGENKSMGQYPA
mgnify:CR=1 FL=1